MRLLIAATIAAAAIAPVPISAQAVETTPSSAPTAIVQHQIDAYNAGDVAAFVGHYAEDAELFDLGPNAGPIMRGREALTAHYHSLFEKYQPKVTILSRIVDGDFVIDRERVSGKGKSKDGVAIYQIVAGRIRRVWFTP